MFDLGLYIALMSRSGVPAPGRDFFVPVGQDVDILNILVWPDRSLRRICVELQNQTLADFGIIVYEFISNQLAVSDPLLDPCVVGVNANRLTSF